MRSLEAGETGLREDHRLPESSLNGFDLGDYCCRGKVIRQRIVVVQANIVKRIPKPKSFKFGSLDGSVRHGTRIDFPQLGDDPSPLPLIDGQLGKFRPYAK